MKMRKSFLTVTWPGHNWHWFWKRCQDSNFMWLHIIPQRIPATHWTAQTQNVLFKTTTTKQRTAAEMKQHTEMANKKQTAYLQNSTTSGHVNSVLLGAGYTRVFHFHLIYKNWSYSVFKQQPIDKSTIDNFPATAGRRGHIRWMAARSEY